MAGPERQRVMIGEGKFDLPDLRDAPTTGLLLVTGFLLGLMACWLISTILFAPPPRYSGLRPETQTLLVIGGAIGLVGGGIAGVMVKGRRAAKS